jgi:outer membrane immunogenic protein
MRIQTIEGVALLAVAAVGPAQAAQADNWTSCYVGVAGGGNWGSSKHIYEGSLGHGLDETNVFSLSGGIFGGTVGCNFQKSFWAFGAENDISWTGISGSGSGIPPFSTLNTFQTKLNWIDTLRVRLGVAWNQWLFYGTGGLAFGDEGMTTCGPFIGCGNQSKVAAGWTAGAGAEYAIWGIWSFKLEYLHADFGRQSFSPTPVGSTFFAPRDITLTNDIVPCWRELQIHLAVGNFNINGGATITLRRRRDPSRRAAAIAIPASLRLQSSHLHRDRPEEVLLADIDAAMTQDRVGRGAMEIEVRQHEVVEVIVALHVTFIGGAERERDLAIA